MMSESPNRKHLPKRRDGHTAKLTIQGSPDTEIYLTTGEFEDGSLAEIFLRVAKMGSTMSGMMDVFAIAISLGLQYGVPLDVYEEAFVGVRFEPRGPADDSEFTHADSMPDLVFKYLGREYGKTLEENS